MAPRRYTAPMRSPAWLTSFWFTNSVDWKSGAVTGTQTWERPTTWVSGRHGSKPAREMIKPRLWPLPISGNGRAACLVVIEIFPVTRFKFPGEDSIFAAGLHLASLESSVYYHAYSSARAVFRSSV